MAPQNNTAKKKTPVGKIILFVAELVVLAALFVVMYFITRATDEDEGVAHISIREDDIKVSMNENVVENVTMKGYKNYALFGVDSRTSQLTARTRTDTIMIASVNQDTKEVRLVSVYRDTFLNQMGSSPDYGKCNASYAYGGAEQAIKMLNSNLDMDIVDFVTVGFEGLRDVVDALGGVYIEVDEDEIFHLNNYMIDMVKNMDDVDSYTAVTETGYQLLNGLQATAYCRIRYTAGNDFKRTERQREVLKAVLEIAKTASPSTLTKICNNVFSEVYTSLEMSEILDLLSGIAEYSIADESGFPAAGMVTTGTIGSKGSCVIPIDLESNVIWLHKFLFNEDDYVPSSTVTEYSKAIYDETDSYLKQGD